MKINTLLILLTKHQLFSLKLSTRFQLVRYKEKEYYYRTRIGYKFGEIRILK